MILLFSVKNFKSIKDELTVDFRKASVSEFKKTLINDNVLPSVVFYGPNGAGKSSIIQAMDFLIKFISVPILSFKASTIDGAPKSFAMPKYKPYLFDSSSKNGPTEYSVLFTLNTENKTEYMYNLEILNGNVLSESLYEKAIMGKPSKLFVRENDKVSFGTKITGIKLNDSMVSPTLSLLSSLSIIYNDTIFNKVSEWFCNVISIDYSDPTMEKVINGASLVFLKNDEIKKSVEGLLTKLNLGIESYTVNNDEEADIFKRVKTIHKNGELTLYDESMGTRKVLLALPAMLISLTSGYPFIVDELDAKIHPKLLEFIISLFTNKSINIKGSQLIFTSHDMHTLSNSVFRRDEVYFVAKDLNDSTICYSLVDIKNEKNVKERSDSSYSKRYLEGKYGADPYFNKMISWGDISNENN